jgi:hypothetical protein
VNPPKIIYKLKCGHNAFAPATLVSGMLYCRPHDDMSPIIGVHEREWRVKCDSCIFTRWAGLSKETAAVFAAGHRSRNSGHSPEVEYVTNPIAARTQENMERFHRGQLSA